MVLILALAGCLKGPPVVKAPQPTDTTVVGVLDPQEAGDVSALPERVHERIGRALAVRDLTPKPVALATFADAFKARQVTAQRLGWLGDNHGESELLVLVEADAVYYSQIEGRNRWTVHVSATVGAPGRLDEALTSTFDVPVILQFVHEKEDRALEEAAPLIERQVGNLLDQYLGAMVAR
jgi:hypothetical protein